MPAQAMADKLLGPSCHDHTWAIPGGVSPAVSPLSCSSKDYVRSQLTSPSNDDLQWSLRPRIPLDAFHHSCCLLEAPGGLKRWSRKVLALDFKLHSSHEHINRPFYHVALAAIQTATSFLSWQHLCTSAARSAVACQQAGPWVDCPAMLHSGAQEL